MPSDCPSSDDLQHYWLGLLPEPRAEGLEQHLEQCPECSRTIASLEQQRLTDPILDRLQGCTNDASAQDDPELLMAMEKAKGLVSGSDWPADEEEGLPIERIGPYRLLEKLGQGGMGTVYRAVHLRLEKPVAVKILPEAHGRSDEYVVRFEQEMRAIGRLVHPHLVQAFDAGETDDKRFLFLAMELVEGQDLARLVAKQGPLPVELACQLVRQAAVGLAYVHQQGRVHRDVKPSNLMLTADGQVKILDLGLALLNDRDFDQVTATSQAIGTPEYMAPEQATNSHRVDARADVYSLGCTLHKLLTGRPPYDGRTVLQIVVAHQQSPIPSLCRERSDVPASLDALFQRMLAKRPEDRQPSMAAVVEELDACLARSGATVVGRPATRRLEAASRPGLLRKIRRTVPGNKKATALTALGLAAALVLGVVMIRARRPDGSEVSVRAMDGAEVTVDKDGTIRARAGGPGEGQARTEGPWGEPQSPPPAIAPFDATQARKHQEAWAEYLGVPIEMTNSIGMKFQLIPPGEFDMGSTGQEIEWVRAEMEKHGWRSPASETFLPEMPRHRVRITRPFYLGAYTVTQGEYERLMGVNPSLHTARPIMDAAAFEPPLSEKEMALRNERANRIAPGTDTSRYPVEMVTWEQAAEFCRRLARLDEERAHRRSYGLPTESQWEYACRAGTTTAWHSGDDLGNAGRVGWFVRNADERTHPVGELLPNAWGLYDMHGNVCQWCSDWFNQDYYAQAPLRDPACLRGGASHVYRGCPKSVTPYDGRSATRRGVAAQSRTKLIGIRVMCEIEPNVEAGPRRAEQPRPGSSKEAVGPPAVPPNPQPLTPPRAVAPFDATQARKYQESWAKYLGVPVQMTNSIGMKFRLIPPGDFDMGATDEEIEWVMKGFRDGYGEKSGREEPTESPRHRVKITRAFYLGIYPVTQGEYEEVMRVNPSACTVHPMAAEAMSPPLSGYGKEMWAATTQKILPGTDTSRNPVEMVTWPQAAEYCRRLASLAEERARNVTYRLPTEAEWEYACRAGTTTAWYNGDDPEEAHRIGWFVRNSEGKTHPVGELLPNAWGMYDMCGNVFQWCSDRFGEDYYSRSPSSDPAGPASGLSYVTRSCACGWATFTGRSASRKGVRAEGRNPILTGLRVVREIKPEAPTGPHNIEELRQEDSKKTTAPSAKTPNPQPPAPPPAVAPFDTQKAKEHQEAWAKHLGVPVEMTNSIGMKFWLIPPGEFDMGSSLEEQAWATELIQKQVEQGKNDYKFFLEMIPTEGPRYRVKITKPFYFGTYPVT